MDIELTDEDRINLLMKHACQLFPGPNQHIIVGVTPDAEEGEVLITVCCDGDHEKFAAVLQHPPVSMHRVGHGN